MQRLSENPARHSTSQEAVEEEEEEVGAEEVTMLLEVEVDTITKEKSSVKICKKVVATEVVEADTTTTEAEEQTLVDTEEDMMKTAEDTEVDMMTTVEETEVVIAVDEVDTTMEVQILTIKEVVSRITAATLIKRITVGAEDHTSLGGVVTKLRLRASKHEMKTSES